MTLKIVEEMRTGTKGVIPKMTSQIRVMTTCFWIEGQSLMAKIVGQFLMALGL